MGGYYNNILLSYEDRIAYVIINRPEARNALNTETIIEIRRALEEIRENQDAGCIVITGSGEKSFISGADIVQLKQRKMIDALEANELYDLLDYIENLEKPSIAMINGFALGGGCELALACDIRVTANHVKMGLPELGLAIMPGAGGTQRLSRIVGKGIAMDMILTGKMISGEDAVRIGLASASVPIENLKEKTKEVADSILSKGPLAVRMAKLSVHMGYETDMKTGLMIERLAKAILYESADKQEGIDAFLEKRRPNFKGK